MSAGLSERLSILRDEALNCAEFGDEATGGEIFDAIRNQLFRSTDTDPGLDLSLHDALSRRLAWGENPAAVLVDCDAVCKRLTAAVLRSFPSPKESTKIIGIITEVACQSARHLARVAAQQTSKERALERREAMVQQQLQSVLDQQEELIRDLSGQLES
jgi:hypothetical protein